MSHDPKCHDLADCFLQDYRAADDAAMMRAAEQIAEAIQRAIEDELKQLEADGIIVGNS